MNKRITLIVAAYCLMLSIANAQISITTLSQTYSENFNNMAATGATGTVLPTSWYSTVSSYRVGNGSTNNGGLYSFGDSAATDRAIGSVGSGSSAPNYGVKFVNNTGASITSITVNYTGEQWRLGQKPALRLDSTLLSYNVGVDSLNTIGWTNVSALKILTPDTTGTAGSRNGNITPYRTLISGTINGLNISTGSVFWLRWSEKDVSGSDDGLAVDDLSVSFTGAVLSPCIEPASSVTNVILNATGTTSVAGSFTASSADGYLVLLDSTGTVPTVIDGTNYTVGQTVGSAVVISNGTSTTFTKTGLVSNTIYKVYVYPYTNTSCSGGPNFKTTIPGNDTAKTQVDACPEPTTAPTNLVFTSVGNNNINGKFNKSVPAADGYVVVYSLSSNIAYPLDSTNYNVGDSIRYSSFKSKVADVSSSANDTTFSITGLTQGTRYYVAVIPYNLCGAFKNYRRSASNGVNRDDTLTGGTAPLTECTQPGGVSNSSIVKLDSTTTTISIKWKNATSDSVMVLAGPTSSIGFVTLHDSTYYAVGSTIPGSGATVYYRGTDSTLVLTGLTINTVYKILIVPFNNKACTFGPNYSSGLASITIRTASTAAGECTNPSGISNATILKLDSTATTISVKWRNSTSDSVMILAGPTATIGFVALRDSVYYPVGSTIPGSGAQVYYRGTDSSFVLTGLTPNTVYKILFVPFNNKACTFGPNYASGLANTTIRTALATGVKYNNSESEFSIFPNPAHNGLLFVKFKTALHDDAVLEVVDILGRKISSQNLTPGAEVQTINVSRFAKGTYILNVIYKGTNNVSSFIVD